MTTRSLVLLTALLASCGFITTPASAEKTLDIGSKAPALDIEHYLSDGNGFFSKVTEFEEGKVYLVEFWATWCGPCIQAMPRLVELQEQHRADGVQIISVSSEDLEKVEALLEKDYPGKEQTFAELTASYTLTVDPDGSVNESYMQAAEQNGIPAAFLVGKTGLIEWIGHPMAVEEPLAKVLDGTWDREAYKEELAKQEQLEAAMRKVNQLAGAGKFDDAILTLDKTIEELGKGDGALPTEVIEQLENLRFNLRLDSGDQSEEVIQYFRKQLADATENPRQLIQFSYGIMSSLQQGTDPGPLVSDTLAALETSVESADEQLKPLMYLLMAQINAGLDKYDVAIEAQKQAVELSEGQQRKRMQQVLDQLEELAGKAASEEKETPEAAE